MEAERLKQVLEAALMITESPLSLDRMMGLFEEDEDPPKRDKVRRTLEELEVDYENSGIELAQVASGYRFQARAELAPWMNRLFEERRPKYSRALLETLAIVAYRQPITRGEIEGIRGVAVSTGIIRTLLEREWVRVVGHRDVPGKPAVYATTKTFLDYFNLSSIDELPSLAELKDFDDLNADLFKDNQVDEGGEGRLPEPTNESADEAEANDSQSESVAEGETVEVLEDLPDEEVADVTEAQTDDDEVAEEAEASDSSETAVVTPTINHLDSSASDTGANEQQDNGDHDNTDEDTPISNGSS